MSVCLTPSHLFFLTAIALILDINTKRERERERERWEHDREIPTEGGNKLVRQSEQGREEGRVMETERGNV